MATGSHHWIGQKLAQCCGGMSHEDLNSWAVDEFRKMRAEGKVLLDYENNANPASAATTGTDGSEIQILEQVVGKAGDVVSGGKPVFILNIMTLYIFIHHAPRNLCNFNLES